MIYSKQSRDSHSKKHHTKICTVLALAAVMTTAFSGCDVDYDYDYSTSSSSRASITNVTTANTTTKAAETTVTTEAETESDAPDIVQAVLENESVWQANLATAEELADECGYDTDIDGTPDFVVMCRPYAAGKGIIKDFMVYYLNDSTFEMYDDASRSYNDLYCNFSFEIGSPNVDDPYIYLYRGNSTGTYRYYTDSGSTSGEGVGYINLSGDYDYYGVMGFESYEEGIYVMPDGASTSSTYYDIDEAMDAMNLTYYETTVDKMTVDEYLALSDDEKEQRLLDSYNAWNYTESSSIGEPFQSLIDDYHEYYESLNSSSSSSESSTSETASGWKDAYISKVKECGSNGLSSSSYYDVEYLLYDMNSDGTPELILKYGTCEADYVIDFYTYKNSSITKVGSGFSGFHTSFYEDTDNKQLVTEWGQQGVGGISWYQFDGSSVTCSKKVDSIYYNVVGEEEDSFDNYGNFKDLYDDTTYMYCFGDNTWSITVSRSSYDSSEMDFSMINNY